MGKSKSVKMGSKYDSSQQPASKGSILQYSILEQKDSQ
jgi:hypothetical protein